MSMNSQNSDLDSMSEQNPETQGDETTKSKTPIHSATTDDVPDFGWSAYAERINGRFAMIGFIAILLIEAISKQTFLSWSTILR